MTGEYRFGDTRHILSDISALQALGWEPRRTPADSVAAYAAWLEGMDGLDGVLAEANARMRALGVVRRADAVKAFLLAAGVGSRLRPITDTTPKCMLTIGDRPLLDIWLDAFDRAGVDEVLVNLHHLPDVVRAHLAARTGPPAVRTFFEPELLGSAGTLLANRQWVEGEEFFLACNADNLTDFDLRSLIDVPPRKRRRSRPWRCSTPSTRPPAASWSSTPPAGSPGSRRSRSRAGFRPDECRHVRLSPGRARRDRWHAAAGHRLRPAATAGGPGPGGAGRRILPRHRHRRGLPTSPRGVARKGRAMIITQTPLRIGLLGGGTDLPGYYREHGGRVLNCAHRQVRVRDREAALRRRHLRQLLQEGDRLARRGPRARARPRGHADDRRDASGVEITTLADIPSAGSGLGSSSAVTVGLLHALFAYQGRQVSAEELAERACTIEIERCGKPIGKQDQYIAALGGIRDIRFGPGDEVVAEELGSRPPSAGPCSSRSCSSTPASPAARTRSWPSRTRTSRATRPQLDLLRDLAGFAVERLRSGDVDAIGPRAAGELGGQAEAGVGGVERPDRRAVSRALDAGASGAKLTGAGGGGFLLVICPMERQRAVRREPGATCGNCR